MDIQEFERIIPHIQVDGIDFLTPNSQCAWRVETLYTKEPCTTEWIRNMLPGQTLFDIGACMGGYTMLAWKQGLRVHAFEPEAQNFALLCRNIAINKIEENVVTAWPLALADKPSIDVMHLSGCQAGGSCHSFGESKNYHGEAKQFPFHQGSVATTIDIFSAKYGIPDHIKIDVDGFEHLVIQGGINTISRIKSVLIEINTAYQEHKDLIKFMQVAGFAFDEAQAESSRRKEGPFKGIGNVIFYKTLKSD